MIEEFHSSCWMWDVMVRKCRGVSRDCSLERCLPVNPAVVIGPGSCHNSPRGPIITYLHRLFQIICLTRPNRRHGRTRPYHNLSITHVKTNSYFYKNSIILNLFRYHNVCDKKYPSRNLRVADVVVKLKDLWRHHDRKLIRIPFGNLWYDKPRKQM